MLIFKHCTKIFSDLVVLTAENTIFLKVYFDNFALLDFNETWRMRCLVSNIW